MYRTTNGGTSWAAANTGMTSNHNILSIIRNPQHPATVYAGTSFLVPNPPGTGPCYVYKSYDGGATWFNSSTGFGTSATDEDVVRALSMSTIDTVTILALRFINTTNGGPWLTTNAGNSWTQILGGISTATVPGPLIRSGKIKPGSNTVFYLGGDYATNSQPPGGVWRTTNAGVNWVDFNSGIMVQTNTVRAINYKQSNNTVYAGVAAGSTGVYEYTTVPPELINHNEQNVPKEYSLHQNFPNPFNPTTMITFDLPKSQDVTLEVYDINGKLVKSIIREFKPAGSYEINFNASTLTSGVYFYKLTTASFVDTKKMILVK
jgi:hypothetical protein